MLAVGVAGWGEGDAIPAEGDGFELVNLHESTIRWKVAVSSVSLPTGDIHDNQYARSPWMNASLITKNPSPSRSTVRVTRRLSTPPTVLSTFERMVPWSVQKRMRSRPQESMVKSWGNSLLATAKMSIVRR
jgi:hypothetical protein